RRLADPRAAGDDEDLFPRRPGDRLALGRRQLQAHAPLHPAHGRGGVHGAERVAALAQLPQRPGHAQFGEEQPLEVEARFFLAHQVHGPVAVGAVDAHGPGGADAVRLEEYHDVADGLLLVPALADLLDAPRADALDLLEEARALVDDPQGALAEDLDDPLGEV